MDGPQLLPLINVLIAQRDNFKCFNYFGRGFKGASLVLGRPIRTRSTNLHQPQENHKTEDGNNPAKLDTPLGYNRNIVYRQ